MSIPTTMITGRSMTIYVGELDIKRAEFERKAIWSTLLIGVKEVNISAKRHQLFHYDLYFSVLLGRV